MGFFGELGSGLRERKRVIAAVLAIACIGVATFLAGAWATSSQISGPRSVAVSAPHPDDPPPPAEPKSGDMCCSMKQPDKMMPSAMPMPSGAPMPGGMPQHGGMPMPSGAPMPGGMPQHGGMPMPGETG
jgi:hypothetical protein